MSVLDTIGNATYVPDVEWPQLPHGMNLGIVSTVALHPSGEILVLQRADPPVLRISRSGQLLGTWGGGMVGLGHGLRADDQGFIWLTDLTRHVVLKCTLDGEVLRTLGRDGEPGDGLDQFNQPTDVAVSADGSFFVSDGYGNARILHFDPNGELIRTWGRGGREPGEFNTPHAMVINSKGHLIVSDRGNTRIQTFQRDGTFLDEWRVLPYIDGMCLAPDDTLYLSTGRGNQILRVDADGDVVESYGGTYTTRSDIEGFAVPPAGRFNVVHGVSVDRNGDLYVAEVRARRVQKLIRTDTT